MNAVMGIDPGVHGGVAILREDRSVAYLHAFQPTMGREEFARIIHTAAEILRSHGSNTVYLERVGHIPGDGPKGAFTFGRVYGLLEGTCLANRLRIRDVAPVMWQSRLGCLSGGNKNITKNAAKVLFPEVKITHAVADCLLLAEYGRLHLSPVAQGLKNSEQP